MVIELKSGDGDGGRGGGGDGGGGGAVWATFPAVFLRDNCASAVHPTTGQRTVPVWELPPDLSIVAAAWARPQPRDNGGGGGVAGTGKHAAPEVPDVPDAPNASAVLEVKWSDGARSTFGHQWLCDHRLNQDENMFTRAALELRPWRVADLPDGTGVLPEIDFTAVMEDDAEVRTNGVGESARERD